ncbi:MAG: glycosyltransferase family 2 protein [Candidatus Thorarchaeota archaeon]
MDVSIIIVNYNTRELTLQCLESIYKKTINIDFEVIMVDNASSDNSVNIIKERFPQIKIIESNENLGFGKANNLGIKVAVGKYVFLLNPDTIFLNNAPKLFYNYMEENNKKGTIGCVGTMLLDADKNSNVSFGYFPTIKNEIGYIFKKIFKRFKADKSLVSVKTENTTSFNVDFVSGADLFIPRKVLEEVGGFDKQFFMFYEETDLQKRMSDKNLKRIIIKEPQIIHLEGGSFSGATSFSFSKFVMSQKSLNYYIDKHFKGIDYFIFRIGIIFIRMTVLFDSRFSFKERFNAFRTVVLFQK